MTLAANHEKWKAKCTYPRREWINGDYLRSTRDDQTRRSKESLRNLVATFTTLSEPQKKVYPRKEWLKGDLPTNDMEMAPLNLEDVDG